MTDIAIEFTEDEADDGSEAIELARRLAALIRRPVSQMSVAITDTCATSEVAAG
jgi:hypothetical protein